MAVRVGELTAAFEHIESADEYMRTCAVYVRAEEAEKRDRGRVEA